MRCVRGGQMKTHFVQQLIDRWRADAQRIRAGNDYSVCNNTIINTFEFCANELEAVLNGGEPWSDSDLLKTTEEQQEIACHQ